MGRSRLDAPLSGQEDTPMLHGLRTVVLMVDDLAAARSWYAETLGFAPYFDEPFYVGFDVDGYELGLHPASEESRPGVGGATAYWAVDDVAAAQAALEARGATVLQPATEVGEGIVVGSVVDPFGNALGLIVNPHFRGDAAHSAEGSSQQGPIAVVGPGLRLGAAPGDVSERRLELEQRVRATPAEVWWLWTTRKGVTSWLVDEARVELRIGGPFELFFMDDAPVGSRGSDGCRILSFLPERMLTFTWNAPPHLDETRPQLTWVVVELTPLPSGDADTPTAEPGTLIRVTHLGWPESGWQREGSQWPATFDYFARAWQQVLTELASHVTRAAG
jgi:predicted enzyme related to lactoylglutathione lyase/uncharacterized protein YndB with AHSA1/START domain